jgi:hypothetical protein
MYQGFGLKKTGVEERREVIELDGVSIEGRID